MTSRAALKAPQVATQVVPRAALRLVNHLGLRLVPRVQLEPIAQPLPPPRYLVPKWLLEVDIQVVLQAPVGVSPP